MVRETNTDFIDRIINNKTISDDEKFLRYAMKKRRKPKAKDLQKFPEYRPNYLNVIDLISLPTDRGFKYCLVVVDVGSKYVGLQAMKSKTAAATLAAIKKIYNRKWLSYPSHRIKTDGGSEFKGTFKTFMERRGIKFTIGIKDRHSSQLHAESFNAILQKIIFLYQYKQEKAGEWKKENRVWVRLIPGIETAYNEKIKKRAIKYTPPELPQTDGEHIIPIGTEVYRYRESPVNPVSNKKLGDRWRQTDLRLEVKPRTIKNWVLLDGQKRVAYQLSGMGKHLFTRVDFVLKKDIS